MNKFTVLFLSLKISSDSRPMILLEKFGFTHLGHVSVTVKDVTSPPLSPPDPSRLGFFLLSDEALIQVIIETETNLNFCILDSHYIHSLFTFKDFEISFHRPPWQISKASCPRNFTLDVVLLDALGHPVNMEMETKQIIAWSSFLQAKNISERELITLKREAKLKGDG